MKMCVNCKRELDRKTPLTRYDIDIGDGLCETCRNAEQVREAKRVWYGKEAAT
jgi:hypothetical protein